MQGLRDDVRISPDSPVQQGRGSLGGAVRPDDPAAEWLDDWARDHGKSPAAERRRAGILTEHQEKEIRSWEVPLDEPS